MFSSRPTGMWIWSNHLVHTTGPSSGWTVRQLERQIETQFAYVAGDCARLASLATVAAIGAQIWRAFSPGAGMERASFAPHDRSIWGGRRQRIGAYDNHGSVRPTDTACRERPRPDTPGTRCVVVCQAVARAGRHRFGVSRPRRQPDHWASRARGFMGARGHHQRAREPRRGAQHIRGAVDSARDARADLSAARRRAPSAKLRAPGAVACDPSRLRDGSLPIPRAHPATHPTSRRSADTTIRSPPSARSPKRHDAVTLGPVCSAVTRPGERLRVTSGSPRPAVPSRADPS